MLEELINKLNEGEGVSRFFRRTEVETFRQWYEKFLKRYESGLQVITEVEMPVQDEVHSLIFVSEEIDEST